MRISSYCNLTMRKFLMLLFLVAFTKLSADQADSEDITPILADIYEQFTEESGVELDFDHFITELTLLHQQPINLNNTQREELEKLLFLTSLQVENILYYLYRFGEMKTLFELQLVEGLDRTDIRRMLPFVFIGEKQPSEMPFNPKAILQHLRHEVITRFDFVPELKAGYQASEMGERLYEGQPWYHHLKYRVNSKNNVFLQFTLEKDAGELLNTKRGYDFNSASVQWNGHGVLSQLIVGDYQVHFGQGLSISQLFSRRKSSLTTHTNAPESGFKRYGSTNEFLFFRGVACVLKWKKWRIMPFVSKRSISASSNDSISTSFYTTGLHRTLSERNKKANLELTTAGVGVSYSDVFYRIGCHVVSHHLNHTFQPKLLPYNYFYFRGKSQVSGSLDYRFRFHNILFFGETAFSNSTAVATLHGLTFNPVSTVKLSVVHRYFPPEYNALFANSFSEASRISNEHGLYMGTEIQLFRGCAVSAYVDFYQFPWLSFGIDAPSYGKDFLLQTQYRNKTGWNFQVRLRHEQKLRNISETTTALVSPMIRSSVRLRIGKEIKSWEFQQTTETSFVTRFGTTTYGLNAFYDVKYHLPALKTRLQFRWQIFDVPDYHNRLYAYEPDVLYAFTFPSFYGTGSKCVFNIRIQPTKALSIYVKWAQTIYADDRISIGSGNERIQGNIKSEFKCLLQWKFR